MNNYLRNTISIILLAVYAPLVLTLDFWHSHADFAAPAAQQEIAQPEAEGTLARPAHGFCLACQFSLMQMAVGSATHHFAHIEIFHPLFLTQFLRTNRVELLAIRAPPSPAFVS